jgi:tripartite-type tricarboxylate transporter receptor subunit TctC
MSLSRRVVYSRRLVLVGIGLAISYLTAAKAEPTDQSVADFYRGKQLRFIISASPGGGYDTMGRLVARHLGQFIPGKPTITAENMPGGGGILAANAIYVAKPDGMTMGLADRGVMIGPLTKQPGVRYDVSKINWIGSVAPETSVAVSWHTSAVTTLQDLLHHQLVVGGSGATSDSESSARLMNAFMGTKFKIVHGYPGLADVVLAMQRGEVQGVADWSWQQLMNRDSPYVKNHLINILVQGALKKAPELSEVPLAIDFIKNDRDHAVAEIYYSMKDVARPVFTSPGVPADRVAAIRTAFVAMGHDSSFLADAERTRILVEPVGVGPIEAFIKLARIASPDVVSRLTEILNPADLN